MSEYTYATNNIIKILIASMPFIIRVYFISILQIGGDFMYINIDIIENIICFIVHLIISCFQIQICYCFWR